MCKRIIDWFKCKKHEESKIVEAESVKEMRVEPKKMNVEELKKYRDAWVPDMADCYMRISHVAAIFGVSQKELSNKIPSGMRRVWINHEGWITDTPSLGLDLGINFDTIDKLAKDLDIYDIDTMVVLQKTYYKARRNASQIM